MYSHLASSVSKPPKLFGDKPKYLPGFGGAPNTPVPPAPPPGGKKPSGALLWAGGLAAAVVAGVWWARS